MNTRYRYVHAAVMALLTAGALAIGCSKTQPTATDTTTSAGSVGPTSPGSAPSPAVGAHDAPGTPDSGDSAAGADVTKIPTPNGEFTVQGAILQKYDAAGGASSPLGMPTSNEQAGPNGGRYSTFDGGAIYWSPLTGAHIIWGGIRDAWDHHGGAAGPLGYPTTAEHTIPGEGWQQSFQHGVITYTDQPHIQQR